MIKNSGWEFQRLLAESRMFLVGAGALGCELIKNFAMAGVCTARPGNLVVTDMDSIEVRLFWRSSISNCLPTFPFIRGSFAS